MRPQRSHWIYLNHSSHTFKVRDLHWKIFNGFQCSKITWFFFYSALQLFTPLYRIMLYSQPIPWSNIIDHTSVLPEISTRIVMEERKVQELEEGKQFQTQVCFYVAVLYHLRSYHFSVFLFFASFKKRR